MKTVSSDVVIDLPVRTVYDQWTQFESYPSFMSGVKEVNQLDDERLYWLVEVGGVERGFEARITEQVPDSVIAWHSTSGPEQVGAVTFTPVDATHTRVELRIDWDPEGFVENVGAMMQLDQARVSADLDKFRDLIESNGFASGAWRGSIGN